MKFKFSKKEADILSSPVLIAFGVVVYIISMSYNIVRMENDLTDAWLPKVCGGAIAILAAVRLVGALLNKDANYAKRVERSAEDISDTLRGAGSVLLLLLYVFSYRSVGFIISTAVYLFVQLTIYTEKGKRHWLLTVAISVLMPILLYLLFVKALNYTLPTGILG